MKNQVCIIGLGYIGLPTAIIAANAGHKICGYDVNPSVVSSVNSANLHIVEPGLNDMLKTVVDSNMLFATDVPQVSDGYVICVPTPFKNENNYTPDLSYVFQAINKIAPLLKDGDFLILESTSPVGTIDEIVHLLQENKIDVTKIHIAYCPERVMPGSAIREIVENDRVIGLYNSNNSDPITNFYSSFVKGRLELTDSKTAELCKLAENSFRDVNIAFANELSMIADNHGIDIWNLIKLANRHPRVNILHPGVGVGGHCIAVDPWFIVSSNPEHAKLIKVARQQNLEKTRYAFNKVIESVTDFERHNQKKPTVACFGLTFKSNIDDLRESPALKLVDQLLTENINILCVEPNVILNDRYCQTDYLDAINGSDIIIFLVNHIQFNIKEMDLSGKIVLDFCGLTA